METGMALADPPPNMFYDFLKRHFQCCDSDWTSADINVHRLAGGRLPFEVGLGGYSANLVVHDVPPVRRQSSVSALLPWIQVRAT